MKKIICFIFGHSGYSYNGGTDCDPEEAWLCVYCGKKLEYNDEHWGLNLNWRVTDFLSKRQALGFTEINEEELPF